MSQALGAGAARIRPAAALLFVIGMTLAVAVHPAAALALFVLVGIQILRPLDFAPGYLMLVTGASFINYTRGKLTFEMSLLSIVAAYVAFLYTLRSRRRVVALPRSPLARVMVPYLVLTFCNYARGLAVGNSFRYATLELIAALAMGSSLLVANQFRRQDLKLAVGWMWVTALGHSGLGFYIYSILHVRTGSIYFTPIPGVVAVLMFNFALRARRARTALLWMAGMLPLLMHQFLSFTRGYWLAIIASVVFSIGAFVWREPDARLRWRRAMILVLTFVGLGLLGAVVLALAYRIRGLGELALSRFSSSVGTRYSFETSSNIVRLVEAAKVLGDILKAPLQGHGLGYAFTVREPLHLKLLEQWFCHENYLLVWLKQGLIGLALFIATLFAALRTALRGRSLEDRFAQSWCMGAAAATVYVLVYCLVHFPLAEVNTTFTMALLWGGAMLLTSTSWHEVRWGAAEKGDRP